MHVALAAAYVGLMIFPSYLAGTAPGEPITVARLAVYGAAIAISVGFGAALRPTWRYALPWLVAGGLFEAEVVLRIAGDRGMFTTPEFYLPLGLLAAGEGCAMWLGGRVRSSR